MDEAWIQQSLARLEALEAQKAQMAASGQTADMAEIDSEIAALYEVLESAAGDEDAAAAVPEAPTYAPPMSPAMHAPAPVMAPPAAQAIDPGMSYSDVDIDPPKSKGPILAAAALVIAGLGAGGWYVAGQQGGAEPVAAAPAGDPEVISASAVPDDTQEPEVAKGGDADRTQGTKYKQSKQRPAPRANHNRRGGGSQKASSRPKKSKKDNGRKVNTINNSRDPLAGVK